MRTRLRNAVAVVALASVAALPAAGSFDHEYETYAQLLASHVRPPRVDYAAIKANRAALDRVVEQFDAPAAAGERDWPRAQRLAFWINAYNAFTLRAIVDRYPIRSRWFTLQPRNSIRQIDGVWTTLRWRAAGRTVTLDDIEHRILRPEFGEPRLHFAINCASVSCPVLAAEPYRARTLDAQLDAAARGYLTSAEGVRVYGDTLRASSLFDWYGDDFVSQYAPLVGGTLPAKERAILGAILNYGAPEAAALAAKGTARITFLEYNWALNDVRR